MDSDKWLEFTVFTGIDKYKAMLSKLIKDSKKLKNNFDLYASYFDHLYGHGNHDERGEGDFMNNKRKCVHIYVKTDGFDKAEIEFLKHDFKRFFEKLSFKFDCDFLSVSYIKEALN